MRAGGAASLVPKALAEAIGFRKGEEVQ